jgi:hypothetical protein
VCCALRGTVGVALKWLLGHFWVEQLRVEQRFSAAVTALALCAALAAAVSLSAPGSSLFHSMKTTLGKIAASIRNIDCASKSREAASASQERDAPVVEHRRVPDQSRLTDIRIRQPWLFHKVVALHSCRKFIHHVAARDQSFILILGIFLSNIRLPGVSLSIPRRLIRQFRLLAESSMSSVSHRDYASQKGSL